MLCLSRRVGEVVHIGDNVSVRVIEIHANHVRLGFAAPRDVAIHREEVLERIAAGGPPHEVEEDIDRRENQT